MNMFHKFFGLEKASHSAKSSIKQSSRANLKVEVLEERHMLAITSIIGGAVDSEVVSGDDPTELILTVNTENENKNQAAIGIVIQSTSDLDPAAVKLVQIGADNKETDVAAGKYVLVKDGADQSMVIVNLSGGKYKLLVSGDDGTLGSFTCDVFMPGVDQFDEDGDIVPVSDLDQLRAQTAAIQGGGNWNEQSVDYYTTLGKLKGFSKDVYNPLQDQYRTAYDVNSDGVISANEAAFVTTNAKAGVVSASLNQSAEDIEIEPELTHPILNHEGVTRVLGIDGEITGGYSKLEAKFTKAPEGAEDPITTLTSVSVSSGKFSLDSEALLKIFGNSVESLPDGKYTIQFVATPTDTDKSPVSVNFEFELYTQKNDPVAEDYEFKDTLYAVGEDSALEVEIEDLVEDEDSYDSHTLLKVIDESGKEHEITHDEEVILLDADGNEVGILVYTGGQEDEDGLFYGGKIVVKPTEDQIALSKGADAIAASLKFIIQDNSDVVNDSEDAGVSEEGTLEWTITATNKTPTTDLEGITKEFNVGGAPYEIKAEDIAKDVNADDTHTYGSITVKVGGTTINPTTSEGVRTWTTPKGTILTLDADSKVLKITPAPEGSIGTGASEDVEIVFTIKDDAGVSADNSTTGDKKSESAEQTLTLKVKGATALPIVNAENLQLTAEQAAAGNIVMQGWTASNPGTDALTYKIGLKSASALTEIKADGTATTIPGLGTFTLSSAGVLTWTVVDESLYRDITVDRVLEVRFSAQNSDGEAYDDATITITPVSNVNFEDQDLYISPNATASDGKISTTGALQSTHPSGTSVAYTVVSATDPAGASFDASKFTIDSNGRIVVSAEDLAEFTLGTYVLEVKATFSADGSDPREITAEVSLFVQSGKATITDGTVGIKEKASSGSTGNAQISGLPSGVDWNMVAGSASVDAVYKVNAYKGVEEYTKTLSTSEQSALLSLISIVKSGNEAVFTINPNAEFNSIFQFLSEGQTAELVFEYQLRDDRYGVSSTGKFTLTITGENDRPTIGTVSDKSSTVEQSVEIDIDDLDVSDPDEADVHTIYEINGQVLEAGGSIDIFKEIDGENVKVGEITVGEDLFTVEFVPYHAPGSYLYGLREGTSEVISLTIIVSDNSGPDVSADTKLSESKTLAITLTGTNKAPVVEENDPVAITEGDPAKVLNASDYATDPNVGDTVKFSEITVGDETITLSEEAQSLTFENGSIITLNPDGTVSFTAGRVPYNQVETVSFQYKVKDDAPTTPLESEAGTIAFAITGAKHEPELLDDDPVVVSIEETDDFTQIDVLVDGEGNPRWEDIDGENMVPEITNVEFSSEDPEVQAFLDELLENHKEGVFDVSDSGQITFRFTADVYRQLGVGQSVLIQLTYKVRGTSGLLSTDEGVVELTINGVNDPPVRLKDPLNMGPISANPESENNSVHFTHEEILSNTNWSDPDFNDNPMSEKYSVEIVYENDLGLGSLSYDAETKTWTFLAGTDFDYLKAGREEFVYITYKITDSHDPNHSALGTIKIPVQGFHKDVEAEDQSFTYSKEVPAGENFVGSLQYDHHAAEKYGFTVDPDSIVVKDSEGNVLPLPEGAEVRFDENGNLFIVSTEDTDWGDAASLEFDATIKNLDENYPDDEITIAITINMVESGLPPEVDPFTKDCTEGEEEFAVDLKDELNLGEDAEFSGLKLVSAEFELAGETPETLYEKLNALKYASLSEDGIFTLNPGTNYFSFVPGDDKIELVFEYVVTDPATGLQSLATITVYVTGVNNAPKAFDYEHKTAVKADDSEGITVHINDLIEDHKVVDPDYQDEDTLVFHQIAGQEINTEFLAGNREILLPSGAKLLVDADARSFLYVPNTGASVENPFYTLKHGALMGDFITYVVKDRMGELSTADDAENPILPNIRINVEGVNKTPVQKAEEDVPSNKKNVDENGSITIWPGDLVYDVNRGDDLQFHSITVKDADGEDVDLEIGVPVKTEHGSILTWNADGSLTFNAASREGNVGKDKVDPESFRFTITDNSGDEETQITTELTHTVSVHGHNDAPVAQDFTQEKQVVESGEMIINVPFSDFFNDPDLYPTEDTHDFYLKTESGDSFVLMNGTSTVRFEGYQCTVRLGEDRKSLDFVFSITVGDQYDVLSAFQEKSLTFDYYVIDEHGAASGSSENSFAFDLNIQGLNKRPVVSTEGSRTVAANETVEFVASNMVSDRNTGDTHVFTTINGVAVSGITGAITLYEDNDPEKRVLGTLEVLENGAKLVFTPNPDFADEDTGLQEDETVSGLFTYTIADNSGAENAETAESTMNLTVEAASHGPSPVKTELVGSIKDPGATTSLNLDEYFRGKELTYQLTGVKSGYGVLYETEDTYWGSNPPDLFQGFLQEGNLEEIQALLQSNGGVLDSAEIPLRFRSASQYNRSLDFSPIILSFTVTDADGNSIESDITIRLEEQFVTEVVLVFTTEEKRTSGGSTWVNPFIDVMPEVSDEPYVVDVGSEYLLEIWVQDHANEYITDGTSTGIVAGKVILPFDGTIASIFGNPISPWLTDVTVLDAGQPNAELNPLYCWAWKSIGADPDPGLALPPNAWCMFQVYISADGSGNPGFQLQRNDFSFISFDRLNDLEGDPGDLDSSRPIHPSQVGIDSTQVQHRPAGADSNLVALSTEEKEVEGGIYMRTVSEPTEIGEGGVLQELPADANMLHEWESHYVELWVKASDADMYSFAEADLLYNSDYFTATQVELGSMFNIASNAVIDDAAGIVSGIGGYSGKYVSKDGYILLGRVKFESIGKDNVPWSASLKPVSLGLKLESGGVRSIDGTWISKLGNSSQTELWANPYDVNDDQVVELTDFVQFSNAYKEGAVNSSQFLSPFDYDRSGDVSVLDFAQFSKNVFKTRDSVNSGKQELILPANYTQRYTGSKLQADDLSNVGKLLDAANQAWADALGLETPIDVQLVVKDFKDSTTLGEAQLVAVDENGLPSKGIITLDNDAAGTGWYSQITDPVNAGKYDLYTTLLHELGHLYGISTSYYAFNAVKDQFGNLVDSTGHLTDPSDVMYAGINTGERKYISVVDVNIIETAYGKAAGNPQLQGFSGTPSKLQGLGDKAVEEAAPVESVSEEIPSPGITETLVSNSPLVNDESTESAPAAQSEVVAMQFSQQEVVQENVQLNVPVAQESAVPQILKTESNERTLAELNTLGLDVSLPQINPTGSKVDSVDYIVGELFPGDEEVGGVSEEDYQWAADANQGESSTLLDQLLAELF